MKYFPGKWEVVGAMVIPGVVAGFLALLPWLDRGPERDPRRRPLIMGAIFVGLAAVVALTTLGWRDSPVTAAADQWSRHARDWRTLDRRIQRLREVPL